ncbi:MAG: hypothetical protein II225_00930, partial [Ruminococcus sp.]|nr:hypothetical protein [Ruminococcus sp.]
MKNFVCRGTSLMLALVMLLLLLPLGATAPAAAFEDVLPAEGETAQETQVSELAEVGSVNEFAQTITDEEEEPSEEEPSVPMIKAFTNTSTGTLITWDAMEGAVKYRVYYINDKGLWQGLGNTTTTSFTHNNLTPGTTYTYTLRILDQNNVAVSDFYKDGFKNTFYASPGITSLTNTASGAQVKWASVGGVDTYRVYKSTNGGTFVSVADVKGNSYMDAEVASGNKYTYSVCCLGEDLSVISGLNQGSSITYFEAPVITSTYNTIDGTKISWLKVNGAVKYRVYYINDKGLWQGIGNTTSTEYTHSGLKDGKTYTYTVRVLNSSGTAVSDFDRQGVSNTYLAPVVVSSLGNTTEGVKVTWGAVDGISTYRLFKKTNGSAWVKVTDVTGTSYTDKDVSSGNK